MFRVGVRVRVRVKVRVRVTADDVYVLVTLRATEVLAHFPLQATIS